jgi:hypothetical protein
MTKLMDLRRISPMNTHAFRHGAAALRRDNGRLSREPQRRSFIHSG